jgi:hypothetical protein
VRHEERMPDLPGTSEGRQICQAPIVDLMFTVWIGCQKDRWPSRCFRAKRPPLGTCGETFKWTLTTAEI